MPDRLEQLLRVQQSVLLDALDPQTVGARVCQGATLLTGAAAARLVGSRAGGVLETLASYGWVDSGSALQEPARRCLADGHPSIDRGSDDRPHVMTVPVDTSTGTSVLQLVARPDRVFGLEHLTLARYLASLASIALRRVASPSPGTATALDSELLLALSHDLRQPLNVLLGYTRLLLEETFGSCGTEQRNVLLTIERHARELNTMLSGALDLARIDREAGTVRYEAVALADLLEELCTGSLADRPRQGVRLLWSSDPALRSIRTDRFRVRQILQNLLDNALRYTEQGHVSVTAAPKVGTVRLIVSDTGPGIEPAALPSLFEPFRTGGAASQRPGGTGCGLYLVKRFTESLGGKITVDTTPGLGTRFTIDLPYDSGHQRTSR